MVYPEDFEQKIGFSTIRGLIIDGCISPQGKKQATRMAMSTSFDKVSRQLHLTDEMRQAISTGLDVPDVTPIDPTLILAPARTPGNHISAELFLELSKYLTSLREISDFFASGKKENDTFSYLSAEFASLQAFPNLLASIDRVITRYGEVKDNASPELHDICRRIESVSAGISGTMRKILGKAIQDGLVEKDTAPAMRDGRLVIPVFAGDKRSINGIVHDVSASGKTAYIEPAEIVEAGNRLRALESEKRHEIIRILTTLTDEIRPYIDDIESSASLVGLFDFIKAKARFAIDSDASLPILEKAAEFEWYGAVHPVLQMTLREQNRPVVPLNISMNRKQKGVIISGPNAGGKSVCLKTIGFVQYMMQCGLLPTLHSNSHMCILNNIMLDIGDSQSIESDLSTYSSHLRNMKQFLAKADKRTLALLDEIGSGTEPAIGGALAQAILQRLSKSGCFIVATTHYHNLKTFADEQEGFVNASMLYDRQQFKPLFQLEIGHPGSSFAIEIARSIGLPPDVIDAAKDLVGTDYVNLDKYLLDIARDRRYWANKRRDIRQKEIRADQILQQYEEKAESLKTNRAEIIREARREAQEILDNTNARIERTIHEIKLAQAEKERTKSVRAELEQYKRDIKSNEGDDRLPDALQPVKSRKKKKQPAQQTVRPVADRLAEGDFVKMKDGNSVGQILSIEGKKAEVAFGALRTKVAIDNLVAAKKPVTKAADQVFTVSRATSEDSRRRQLNFNTELDVRGMRADEALQAVTYFLDDATQFSASRVRILHGTGTGALRVAIRQYLQTYPSVKTFRDEDVRFGGAGITVVELS